MFRGGLPQRREGIADGVVVAVKLKRVGFDFDVGVVVADARSELSERLGNLPGH